jgi:glycosyltransferase involved in cell wall biosynthesis
MAANGPGQSTVGEGGKQPGPRKRVLIEASKLADEKMDGIKRYVVELLREFSRLNPDGARIDLDIMIHDEVCPLADLPGGSRSQGESDGHRSWLSNLGGLFPPILLYPIRWLIPDWASRRFLGKAKSELQVPALHQSAGKLPLLLLPPILVGLFQKLIPERLVQYLWAKGTLEPLSKDVDPEPYDLIHLTLPNNHHYIRRTSTPMLVTVHDLCHIACPQYQTRANSVSLRMGLDRSVAAGADFLTVSHATQSQLVHQYGLAPGRVDTVHNGCSPEHFHPVQHSVTRTKICRKYQIPDSPFLLALSTIEPRKNLARTIRAFDLIAEELNESKISLVIAGARGWKSNKVIRAVKNSPRIHLTGYIADEDLASIYSSARGFVYISHYEGFGLPLLEAMCCGVPVIYGNNSSMPEIVGDAGLAADPGDIRDIARQMRRLICDDELVESLKLRALDRAAAFSWSGTAMQTMALYEKRLGLKR